MEADGRNSLMLRAQAERDFYASRAADAGAGEDVAAMGVGGAAAAAAAAALAALAAADAANDAEMHVVTVRSAARREPPTRNGRVHSASTAAQRCAAMRGGVVDSR